MKKSMTFLWNEKHIIFALCRAYYINKNNVEIGDAWVNEECRGKYTKNGGKYTKNGEKISTAFMKKIINKIWKKNPDVKILSLIVDKINIPAIKLYEKLNFIVIQEVSSKELNIKDGLYMARKKIM